MSLSAKDVTNKKLPTLVGELIDEILEINPMHQKIVGISLENMSDQEISNLETYLSFSKSQGQSVSYLVDCYLMMVMDVLKEQIYFQKHKKYRYSTLDEVAGSVYHDPNYMTKYMYGVAISCFMWPNHLEMLRFFKKTVPKDKSGTYLEVGPGHGLYFMSAMESCKFNKYMGIDISETSIGITKSIVEYFQPQQKGKYSLELKDFLDADQLKSNTYDAVVTGEVLEHVEEPELFLRRIADIAKPDAYIYVTTCCNAAVIDHIYLFRNIKEVEDMMESCGLKVVSPLYLPYEGKSLDECLQKELPISVAYVLQKKI